LIGTYLPTFGTKKNIKVHIGINITQNEYLGKPKYFVKKIKENMLKGNPT